MLLQAVYLSISQSRLDETVAESVTSPDGSHTEQADDDERQSHEDKGDPSEGLGSNELVAVNEVTSTAVSAGKSSRVDGSSDQPEEPAGWLAEGHKAMQIGTYVMASQIP
jgi:hypothetical protein